MKRQKVFLDVRRAMREAAFGSTERDDRIDLVEQTHGLSSAQLRHLCLAPGSAVLVTGPVNYWAR